MADMHTSRGLATIEEHDEMADRMMLYIFPNEPKTREQLAAFEKAVQYQIDHEKSRAEARDGVPDGVSSVRIGDFSVTFSGESSERLTSKTICDMARSVLLRAGLLYRGLEGR